MNQPATDKTMAMIAAALEKGGPDALMKAFTQATGLVYYDLQPAARKLYPVVTPLRNMIPRVSGNGDTAARWKAITAINANNQYGAVSEGNRGGAIATTLKNYIAPYKSLGYEDFVTFEADLAALNFDDAKARAVEGLLRSLMLYEETVLVGGNTSLNLGTPGTATLAAIPSGGTIPNATPVHVRVVALTLEGFQRASIAGGIPLLITRTNTDSSVDTFGGGSSNISADATVTTAAANSSVQASWPVVNGAVAYAVFVGATAAGATLAAITTINSIVVTAAVGAGTQLASSVIADNSTNALVFDGLLSLIYGAGQESPAPSSSGALVSVQATGTPGIGTPLTADGAGAIVEIDADLRQFWDQFKLWPTHIFVNSQELVNITKKVVAGGGAPLFRFNLDANTASVANGTIQGGTVIGTYLNKFTTSGGALVKIVIHPNVPAGTILYYSAEIPYQFGNVPNPIQVKTRRDYYQTEWPLRSRKYEYGVYADEMLQMYFPPAFGARTNIANG